jgi:phospholipid-translocating ATPase
VSFLITVSGWWAWNAFLGGVYSDNLSPYDIKGGFSNGFGKDPNWWLVLLLTLAILTTIEVALKAVRRKLAIAGMWPLWKLRRRSLASNEKELDVELWQEMERNHRIREDYGEPASNDCDN